MGASQHPGETLESLPGYASLKAGMEARTGHRKGWDEERGTYLLGIREPRLSLNWVLLCGEEVSKSGGTHLPNGVESMVC